MTYLVTFLLTSKTVRKQAIKPYYDYGLLPEKTIMNIKKTYNFFIFFTSLATMNIAHAGLIQADYLSTGDNGAVLDTKTNLTWLDFSHTVNLSYNDAESFIDNYRYATNDEVTTLLNNYFGDIGYGALGIKVGVSGAALTLANGFMELFGINFNNFSQGLYKDEVGILRLGGVTNYAGRTDIYGPDVTISYDFALDAGSIARGSFLVKDVPPAPAAMAANAITMVPEPMTLALFITSGLLLLRARS